MLENASQRVLNVEMSMQDRVLHNVRQGPNEVHGVAKFFHQAGRNAGVTGDVV